MTKISAARHAQHRTPGSGAGIDPSSRALCARYGAGPGSEPWRRALGARGSIAKGYYRAGMQGKPPPSSWHFFFFAVDIFSAERYSLGTIGGLWTNIFRKTMPRLSGRAGASFHL